MSARTDGQLFYQILMGGGERCAMPAFGHEETEARRVIIVGGGNIGLYLAEIVEKEYPHVSMKLIELDKKRAEFVAQALERTVVINGNALDCDSDNGWRAVDETHIELTGEACDRFIGDPSVMVNASWPCGVILE